MLVYPGRAGEEIADSTPLTTLLRPQAHAFSPLLPPNPHSARQGLSADLGGLHCCSLSGGVPSPDTPQRTLARVCVQVCGSVCAHMQLCIYACVLCVYVYTYMVTCAQMYMAVCSCYVC